MAPTDDLLLRNLCQNSETISKAKAILLQAQAYTRPGSGYNLGPYTNGLPAICAYIASERLQNGDVKKAEAQAAACLKPSDFDKCCKMVENVMLTVTGLTGRRSTSNLFYETLIEDYNSTTIPLQNIMQWIRKAAQILDQLTELPTGNESVKYAIVFWIFSQILGTGMISKDAFAKKHKVLRADFQSTHAALQRHGESTKRLIATELDRISRGLPPTQITATPTPSPRKSPTKKPLRVLPTRDSPQKRKTTVEGPVGDVEMADVETLETPTKKRKLDLSAPTPSSSRVTLDTVHHPSSSHKMPPMTPKSLFPSTPHHTQPPPRTRAHTATLAEPAAMDVDVAVDRVPSPIFSAVEDEEEDEEPPMRFRPVFLDHEQWNRRDPRLEVGRKRAEAYGRAMVERYGHPFEHLRPEAVGV